MSTNTQSVIRDLEEASIRRMLRENFIGSLAFIAHQDPQVLPITYFFDESENSLISYSEEGHKIHAMRENPSVSLGVYEVESPARWQSVLVQGIYEELEQIDAKAHLRRFSEGIRNLLSQKGIQDDAFISDFSSKISGQKPQLVYRIRILEWSGKYRGES